MGGGGEWNGSGGAGPPPPWVPAPYRVRGRLFAGTTIIGRRAGDAGEGGFQTRPYSRGGVGCSVEGEEGERGSQPAAPLGSRLRGNDDNVERERPFGRLRNEWMMED